MILLERIVQCKVRLGKKEGIVMGRTNLYVHYDAVTNHMMTRAVSLTIPDFPQHFFPKNMILAETSVEFGRFDSQTNFKILRGREDIKAYLSYSQEHKMRISNWLDFDSLEDMHQLVPSEIAEILYLFHANKAMKSAFFYKLQNNYVYLTLPNGLTKTYYRHVQHFYPRFQRVLEEEMTALLNESKSLFFMRKGRVTSLPEEIAEELAPVFSNGLKINFQQAYEKGSRRFVPLDIIEDELTLLTLDQKPKDHIGFLIYDSNSEQWELNLALEAN